MARHKVCISGVNTANIKVLTNEEMRDLFKSMNNGSKDAREMLVNGNLKLVLSILKRFNKKDENMDDLFQIGCVGLLKAIDNFDVNRGVKFSTYAVPMILGEVRRYLRDNSSIRVSRSVKDTAYKVLKLRDQFAIENGREPNISELADILDMNEVDIVNAMDALRSPVSIFEPIYNDGGDTIYLLDQIEDVAGSKDLDMKIAIDKAISTLNEREQYIIDQRFFVGRTQMEIAEEIGISQAQISRLEKSALSRIRKQL